MGQPLAILTHYNEHLLYYPVVLHTCHLSILEYKAKIKLPCPFTCYIYAHCTCEIL